MTKFDFPLAHRWRALGFFYLCFAFAYSAAALFQAGAQGAAPISYGESFGGWIAPRLPESIWIYWLQPVFIAFCFSLFRRVETLNRTLREMLLILGISCVIFILLPTTLPRERLAQDAVNGTAFALLYAFDPPTNCFPSLHVSIALIVAWRAGQELGARVYARGALIAYAAVIAVTTLTTGQHHVLDVIGGIWVAMGVAWMGEIRSRPETRANEG